MSAIVLVGEANPYGGDPYYALYPAPDGCTGHRLCCKILGMSRNNYLTAFTRVNLCPDKWSVSVAIENMRKFQKRYPRARYVLLGAKVASVFDVPFAPWTMYRNRTVLVLPHPSGRNRLWLNPNAIPLTRAAMLDIAPELKDVIS